MPTPSKFFNENIQLAGGVKALARTDAEKFNLYAGLESLSLLAEDLSQQVRQAKTEIEDTNNRVKKIQRKLDAR
jgi:predicted  nucleic acid-binding Zn-ribbon protein